MMTQSQLVIFGEVLFDCFPDGNRVLGGAPFNVAWNCQAFGLEPLLISRTGDDVEAQQIRQAMQEWGMDLSGLQLDDMHPTGKVQVSYHNNEPAYEIVENSAWDFIDKNQLPELKGELFLYHGSLSLRNAVSSETLQYLKTLDSVSTFVDVNLRDPWWNIQTINEIIKACYCVKLNEHELELIINQNLSVDESIVKLRRLVDTGILIVTRGEHGVVVSDGPGLIETYQPELADSVIDTVGAGDAFSSIYILGTYYGWDLQTTVQRAQSFASAVVGLQGATTRDVEFYKQFIKQWRLPE